jgi:hypothetical protein
MNFEKLSNTPGALPYKKFQKSENSPWAFTNGEEGIDWEYDERGIPRRIEKTEEANPQDPEQAIDEQINSHQETIKDTQNEINGVREKLGLPPTDEIPPSVQVEQERLEALEEERGSHNDENSNEESSVTEEPLQPYQERQQGEKESRYQSQVNQALQEITQGSEPLIRALKDREKQGLTPLRSEAQMGSIVTNFRSLSENRMSLNSEDIQGMADTVNRIAELFQGFGPERGAPIRDNVDNLTKLAYGARELHDALESASKKLLSEEGDGLIEESKASVLSAVKNLNERSGAIYNVSLRLRQIVSGQR